MWLFLSPSSHTVPGPWWGRALVPDRALIPAGFGTGRELEKRHDLAVPRKLWHHNGKAEWEQRWVCLGWHPGNGCLLGSIGVSCKEKCSLLGTLPWHKMGAKLRWLGDLELWLPHQPPTTTVAQWGWVRLLTAPQLRCQEQG